MQSTCTGSRFEIYAYRYVYAYYMYKYVYIYMYIYAHPLYTVATRSNAHCKHADSVL